MVNRFFVAIVFGIMISVLCFVQNVFIYNMIRNYIVKMYSRLMCYVKTNENEVRFVWFGKKAAERSGLSETRNEEGRFTVCTK